MCSHLVGGRGGGSPDPVGGSVTCSFQRDAVSSAACGEHQKSCELHHDEATRRLDPGDANSTDFFVQADLRVRGCEFKNLSLLELKWAA